MNWHTCIFLKGTKNLAQHWKFLTIIWFWIPRMSSWKFQIKAFPSLNSFPSKAIGKSLQNYLYSRFCQGAQKYKRCPRYCTPAVDAVQLLPFQFFMAFAPKYSSIQSKLDCDTWHVWGGYELMFRNHPRTFRAIWYRKWLTIKLHNSLRIFPTT